MHSMTNKLSTSLLPEGTNAQRFAWHMRDAETMQVPLGKRDVRASCKYNFKNN